MKLLSRHALSLAGVTFSGALIGAFSAAGFCVFMLACGGGGGGNTVTPPPPAQTPQITWSVSSVEPILSPGETSSQNVTFRSNLSVQNAVVEATGPIAQFIAISPNSIANVQAGQDQTIQLMFSIPAGTALATLNGTVQVKSGEQALSQILLTTVNVWNLSQDKEADFEIRYPPDWMLDTEISGYFPRFKSAADPSCGVRIVRLPSEPPETLDEWFARVASTGGLPGVLVSSTSVTVGSEIALKAEFGPSSTAPSDLVYFYLLKDRWVYALDIGAPGASVAACRNTATKVISSFSFGG